MSTELAVIEDTEVAPATLTEGQARVIDKRIRQAGTRFAAERDKLLDLLNQAAEGSIHKVLGFKSWTAYVQDAVDIAPANPTERKALVSLLNGKGMSQRAIADTLNTSQATVSRDIESDSSESPDTTTGLDGREYKRKAKDEDPNIIDAEVVEEPKAPPISAEFRDEMYNLVNVVSAFNDLLADDRFTPRSRNAIAKKHLNDLQEAIKGLGDVVDALMED